MWTEVSAAVSQTGLDKSPAHVANYVERKYALNNPVLFEVTQDFLEVCGCVLLL